MNEKKKYIIHFYIGLPNTTNYIQLSINRLSFVRQTNVAKYKYYLGS